MLTIEWEQAASLIKERGGRSWQSMKPHYDIVHCLTTLYSFESSHLSRLLIRERGQICRREQGHLGVLINFDNELA